MDPLIIILALIWTFLAIVLLFLLVKSDIKYYYKLMFVPLTFGLLYYTIMSTIGLLGFPYHEQPNGKFMIVKHRTITESSGEEFILLWVYQNGKDRLYKFDAREVIKKKLRKAAKRQEATGIPQFAEPIRPKSSPFESSRWQDLKVYDFPHQEFLSKE